MPEPACPNRHPAESGALIAVVGPSGAGKDSLISYARSHIPSLPAVLFVRRVVTRRSVAATEDHDTLSAAAFEAALASGAFAVHWEAHGLRYAIPAEVGRHVADGGVAVVNGSRAALPAIRSAFSRVLTVHVTCRPDVLAARLKARGREDGDEQLQRLARATMTVESSQDTIAIDNSDDLPTAGEALVAVVRSAMAGDRPADKQP